MIFKLTADAEFEADDIDDALIRLSVYFAQSFLGDKNQFIRSGEIGLVMRSDQKDLKNHPDFVDLGECTVRVVSDKTAITPCDCD